MRYPRNTGTTSETALEIERVRNAILLAGYRQNTCEEILGDCLGAIVEARWLGLRDRAGLFVPVSSRAGFVPVAVENMTGQTIVCARAGMNADGFYNLPIRAARRLLAVLVVEPVSRAAVDRDWIGRLRSVGECLAPVLVHLEALGELRRSRDELERLTQIDELTRVFTRRHFFQRLAGEINRARRSRMPLSLALLDLDGFKAVNDSYGHAAGDIVLREIGRALCDNCRNYDFAGRLGGEEFAIALPNTTREQAVIVSDRLRRSLADRPITLNAGRTVRVTASFGVSQLRGEEPDHASLLERADDALYAAKRAGRNRVRLASEAA